jgi:predicted DNA-binding transcriptional regulator AlpA
VRLITFAQLGPEKGISHCRDHVRRLVKVGKFPAPIQLSDHKIAWLEAEIDAMIAARAEERNKKPINSRPPEPKRLPGRPRKISPPVEVDSRPAVPLAAAAVE